MLPNIHENAWLYHRGKWSKIRNLIYDVQLTYATPHRQSWRQILRENNQIWGTLGPAVSPAIYSGIHVYIYSHTGNRKALSSSSALYHWVMMRSCMHKIFQIC
jgi:hypothetical protein